MTLHTRFAYVLTVLCILGLVPGIAEARKLAGSLSLAEGLSLMVDLKEGFFSETMRFVRLKSSPREKFDLSQVGEGGDRIFIGSDYYLYCQKKGENGYTEENTFKIGRAHKLWDIKLADGVVINEVESVMSNFTGNGGAKSISVTIEKKEQKASDVERAGFKFWCDEIVYQYDSPGAKSKDKPDNFKVISASVLGALPAKSDANQEQFNNFKVFAQFIKESKDSDLVPFRALLEKKLERQAAEKGAAKDDGDKFDTMTKEYEKLKENVMKRTEGF